MVEDDISLKEPLKQDQFDISHTTKKVPLSNSEKNCAKAALERTCRVSLMFLKGFGLMLPDTG